MTLDQYSSAVKSYLETHTDFYSLLDKVAEEIYDSSSDELLLATARLISKGYETDAPVETISAAIYDGFVASVNALLGSFTKIPKNKIN